jgi:hypothetical protein
MRLVYTGIKANSLEHAARIGSGKPTSEADEVEDAEGRTFATLVDVDGDTEYAQSRCIDTEDGRLLDMVPQLLRFLSDFLAVSYAGNDFWPDRDALLERARRLLRRSKGRRPA